AVRAGLPRLLAQSRAVEKDALAGAARNERRHAAAAGGRRDAAPPRRGIAPEPAVARGRGDRARIRRGDDLLGPRAIAADGFREDVAGGAGPRQGGDRAIAATAVR